MKKDKEDIKRKQFKDWYENEFKKWETDEKEEWLFQRWKERDEKVKWESNPFNFMK